MTSLSLGFSVGGRVWFVRFCQLGLPNKEILRQGVWHWSTFWNYVMKLWIHVKINSFFFFLLVMQAVCQHFLLLLFVNSQDCITRYLEHLLLTIVWCSRRTLWTAAPYKYHIDWLIDWLTDWLAGWLALWLAKRGVFLGYVVDLRNNTDKLNHQQKIGLKWILLPCLQTIFTVDV